MDPHDRHINIVFTDGAYYLSIDKKPFLILGGQLAASSTTSAAYMSGMWNKLADTGANTVFAPISWDSVERHEGHFDFSIVDHIVLQARHHGIKVVLQWFGSLKGGQLDSKFSFSSVFIHGAVVSVLLHFSLPSRYVAFQSTLKLCEQQYESFPCDFLLAVAC